ncbi:MAG: cell division protein FtsQ/DivIB [Pseudomonadota bacterium]
MPQPVQTPVDVRFMNGLSAVFILAFVLMVLAVTAAWLVRQPIFNLGGIAVQGDLAHNNAVTLRANVAPRLTGNFFTVDLGRTRSVFESVPWVRRAVVKRQFPNRLKVVLQEHEPMAYWGPEGDSRLVNSFGEVFEANQGEVEAEDLPELSGPQGQSGLVLQVYEMLSPLFDKLDTAVTRLELTGQGSWRARLDSGAQLELGHGNIDEIQARAQRFISTFTQVSARYGKDFESVDLRYGNGYAIRLRGVTTINPGDQEDRKVKR